MAKEPRKPTRAIRVFSLALVSCLALAAAMASSATAVSFHPQKEVFPAEFDLSGSSLQFVTESATIGCEGTTGSGKMESETAGSVTLEILNCKWLGGSTCKTIVTKPLRMDLAKLPGGGDGIVFDPIESNVFAEFSCGGNYVWSGSVIGEITSPGYYESTSEPLSVVFSGSSYEQEYTQTYHGREAQILSSVNGGKNEKTALYFNADLGNFYGEEGEFELSPEEDGHPDLVPDAGFPLSYSGLVSGEKAVLHVPGTLDVTCTKTKTASAGTDSGKFSDSHSGEIELTFLNCTGPLGVKCNSPGQEKGTIKTVSLPVELTYLSDVSPGLAIKANKASNKVMEFKCSFLASTVVKGGVLGGISYPLLGERAWGFGTEMNTAGESEGYAQEYTKTESGEKVGLTAEVNGGAAETASLSMSSSSDFASFPTYAELRE